MKRHKWTLSKAPPFVCVDVKLAWIKNSSKSYVACVNRGCSERNKNVCCGHKYVYSATVPRKLPDVKTTSQIIEINFLSSSVHKMCLSHKSSPQMILAGFCECFAPLWLNYLNVLFDCLVMSKVWMSESDVIQGICLRAIPELMHDLDNLPGFPQDWNSRRVMKLEKLLIGAGNVLELT